MQTNKRYWLRGGIIGLTVAVLLLLIFNYTSGVYCTSMAVNGPISSCPTGFDAFVINFHMMFTVFDKVTLYLILPSVLIGCILGYFYGKVKNKKKV